LECYAEENMKKNLQWLGTKLLLLVGSFSIKDALLLKTSKVALVNAWAPPSLVVELFVFTNVDVFFAISHYVIR
jgi:hypothetical protein